MFSLRTIIRNRCLHCTAPIQAKRFLSTSKDDSRHSDSSDDEKDTNKAAKNTDALKKLNFLLKSMMTEEKKSELSDKLARPKVQTRKKSETNDVSKESPASGSKMLGDSLPEAAKIVAESLGGDVQRTESELLSKLRSYSVESTKTNGDQDPPKPSISLSDLIVGMKIDRTPKASPESIHGRAHQVRSILSSQQRQRGWDKEYQVKPARERRSGYQQSETYASRVNIFGGEPLGIFQSSSDLKPLKDSPAYELTMWNHLKERELKLAVTHPPSNIFEEMILWTERGKLWKFPIDNEQGLEEDAKVYFTEHVFLEHHLEPWCPRVGPIRHFMELVCVGLSKNPYITAEDKRNNIDWFRQYFEKKEDLLKQVGALGTVPSQKGIEG